MSPTALVCGISGQDGAYLAKFLLDRGYSVVGTSRDAEISPFRGLEQLGIRDRIKLRSMTLTDFRSVLQVLTEEHPAEIYNLAGQSSVALSFTQPVETLESFAYGTLNLLEVLRYLKAPVRLFSAASGECFGETRPDRPATEDTPFRPRSPYGVAKAATFWEVANYREAYGLFACSGILFNHESILRPARFVTRKVIKAARRIADGSQERLRLGEVGVVRDWGWAPEYVEAMWAMTQQSEPRDYVIATGESHSLADFIAYCFEEVGLDWRDHTDTDPSLFRPSEIMSSYADPSRARDELGWSARTKLRDLVRILVKAEETSPHTEDSGLLGALAA